MVAHFINLIGQKFGKLTVIKRTQSDKYRKATWLCLCDCGDTVVVPGRNLLNVKNPKSCGCLERKRLVGKIFGNLTVIEYSHIFRHTSFWKCVCSCGKICIKDNNNLYNGSTKTCGKCHLLIEEKSELIKEWDFDKNKNIDISNINTYSDKYAWWICQKCGNNWSSIIKDRSNGVGCPVCKKSKGEKIIANLLNKYNIKYTQQKSFENCKLQRNLKFDFYLLDYNLCIEYQGEQHYQVVDFSYHNIKKAHKQFKLIQKRDKIKRNFCKQNNIRLLEIPYWKKNNIENIVLQILGDRDI